MKNSCTFAFFGTDPLAKSALDALESAGYTPTLIFAAPDKVDTRNGTRTPPTEKIWAAERHIEVRQPAAITDATILELSTSIWDVFIVASYGKLLPEALLSIPAHGVLNIHPSLLPRLRGSSPIRSAILADEKETGVTVMRLDSGMDTGDILAQKKVPINPWPPYGRVLDEVLAREGGVLLAEVLPAWLRGEITPIPQDHTKATFSKKIKKEDGNIDLADDPYQNFLKIRGYDGWPGTYFFAERNGKQIRVIIKDAEIVSGTLKILRVLPEGKKEMGYEDFLRGF